MVVSRLFQQFYVFFVSLVFDVAKCSCVLFTTLAYNSPGFVFSRLLVAADPRLPLLTRRWAADEADGTMTVRQMQKK